MSSSPTTIRPRAGWRCFMRRLLLLLDALLVGMLDNLRAQRAALPARDPSRAELDASIANLESGRAWIADRLAHEDGVDDLDFAVLPGLQGVWNYSLGGGRKRLAGLTGGRALRQDDRSTRFSVPYRPPGLAAMTRAYFTGSFIASHPSRKSTQPLTVTT